MKYRTIPSEPRNSWRIQEQVPKDEHIQEIPSDPEESEIDRLVVEMLNRGFQPNVILTNIYQVFRFWEFRQFKPLGEQRRGLRSPEGYFRGIPVFHSRLLPKGLTIVLDREQLGNLEVKTDFTISVSDIRDIEERRSIEERFRSFNLDEKVRILSYELVRPTIRSENHNVAFLLARTRGTQLEIEPPIT